MLQERYYLFVHTLKKQSKLSNLPSSMVIWSFLNRVYTNHSCIFLIC